MPDAAGPPEPAPHADPPRLARPTWRDVRLNVLLFVLTVVSVFDTGAIDEAAEHGTPYRLLDGWKFAVPLLAILLAHEFGHYFTSRYHRVPASLPYFIPLPRLGPLGTMGAVISMRDTIRSRNALLDVGASGPLAGLAVAIPVLFWGIAHSPVEVNHGEYWQEGQNILYSLIKWLVHGRIPAGHDVHLHPAAFAGWAGLLLTLINLVPFGQLDGGHVAYALFGERQNRFAPWFRWALLPLWLLNLGWFLLPALEKTRDTLHVATAIGNSLFWLEWFVLLGVLARFSGRDHPPVEPGALSGWRKAIAWLTLAVFVVLFMPTPLSHVVP
ncbi:MAG TPA: site-2 protease family protein [Polyangiaceae bacterium]|nr:site-2 protease family protein [Polyangiaceae bacterium]